MKRYLVFAGANYYPEGGWGDFVMDYDDLEETRKQAKALKKRKRLYDWVQIIDSETKEEVH